MFVHRATKFNFQVTSTPKLNDPGQVVSERRPIHPRRMLSLEYL